MVMTHSIINESHDTESDISKQAVLGWNLWWHTVRSPLQAVQESFGQHYGFDAAGEPNWAPNAVDVDKALRRALDDQRFDLVKKLDYGHYSAVVAPVVTEEATAGSTTKKRALAPKVRLEAQALMLDDGSLYVACTDTEMAVDLKHNVARHMNLYLPQDLSEPLRGLVDRMNGITLRPGQGGVYFVPRTRAAEIEQMRALLAGFGSGCRLLTQRVIDAEEERRTAAFAAHDTFKSQLTQLQDELSEIRRDPNARASTVANRMLKVRELRQNVQIYLDVLGMKKEVMEEGLAAVLQQANAVLALDSEDL